MIDNKEVEFRIEEVIKECFEMDNSDEINHKDTLVQLGINSINFIRLIATIEQKLEIEFNDEMYDFNNEATLYDLINKILVSFI